MKSVLYIEDEEGAQHVFQRLYRDFSKRFHGEVEFRIAQNWKLGVLEVEHNRPDVVIADLTLPDSDQAQTIASIEALSDQWPPIVILTGDEVGEEKLRVKCVLEAGAQDFFLKKDVIRDTSAFCKACYLAHLRNRHASRTAA